MERQYNKIIITRRVWQLIAAIGFVLMATFVKYYPLGFQFVIRLFASIFLIVFSLTYMREERRAMNSPDSNIVINWNLAESILLLFSLLGFLVIAFIHRINEYFFYAYLNTGLLGLLSGVAIGEFFWQNTRLRELKEPYRQRYWADYKDSIWR